MTFPWSITYLVFKYRVVQNFRGYEGDKNSRFESLKTQLSRNSFVLLGNKYMDIKEIHFVVTYEND